MIRHYRNNEEGTAIVEHVEMTRAELDAALSVARETAYREAAEEAQRRSDEADYPQPALWFEELGAWLTEQADAEARKRGGA